MSKVLFANELGGGSGHVTALVSVAEALGLSSQAVFALPRSLNRFFKIPQNSHIEPSFLWRRNSVGTLRTTVSFADAIEPLGFAEVGLWRKAVKFWSDLLDRERPSLIVADSAPSLRLAAVGRVPVVAIGNGYALPPANRLLPNLLTGASGVPALSRRREALILAAVNQVQAERRGSTLDYVSDLFHGDASFIGSLPALDHYREYRTGPTWWPCNVPLPRPARDVGSGPAIFCYMHAEHPSLEPVLRLLGDLATRNKFEGCLSQHPVQAYFHDGSARQIAAKCGPGVFIHSHPADLNEMLANARLFIHHSGSGVAHHGLASGVVHLLLPLYLEHMLTARRLEAIGVGGTLLAKKPNEDGEGYYAALRIQANRLLESSYYTVARRNAQQLYEAPFSDPLAAIAAACENVLRSGSAA